MSSLLNFRKSCSSHTNTDLLFSEDDPVEQWDSIAGFCRDSASVIRVFQTQSGSEYGASDNEDNNNIEICDINANSPYATNNHCDDLTDLKM